MPPPLFAKLWISSALTGSVHKQSQAFPYGNVCMCSHARISDIDKTSSQSSFRDVLISITT